MNILSAILALAAMTALPLAARAASEAVYEGHYVWGAEVETFAPCGTGGKAWWVIADEPDWVKLRDTHQGLTTEPYEEIYVRVIGDYAGEATEERSGAFSLQYDGLFRVDQLLLARKRSAADCTGVANPPDSDIETP